MGILTDCGRWVTDGALIKIAPIQLWQNLAVQVAGVDQKYCPASVKLSTNTAVVSRGYTRKRNNVVPYFADPTNNIFENIFITGQIHAHTVLKSHSGT